MVKIISKGRLLPEWARRIEQLRKDLNLSQSKLGQELQYSSMAVSRWERGLQEPDAACYIKLARLVGKQGRSFFLERAGLTKDDMQSDEPRQKSASPNFEIVVAGSGGRKHFAKKTALVALPLLKVHAGSHGEQGDKLLDLSQAPREEIIAAPMAWCPNPDTTRCLRVKGKSMIPLIYDGDILAVDSSQTKHSNLNNKIVVAWHAKNGLSVSRFRHIDGVELLESDNREYEPITLSADRNWRVAGKVLWLIRQTA